MCITKMKNFREKELIMDLDNYSCKELLFSTVNVFFFFLLPSHLQLSHKGSLLYMFTCHKNDWTVTKKVPIICAPMRLGSICIPMWCSRTR